MTALRDWLRTLNERRRSDRRAPAISTTADQAEALIRETKYSGITITHWRDGEPKRIEFPNPVGIELRR